MDSRPTVLASAGNLGKFSGPILDPLSKKLGESRAQESVLTDTPGDSDVLSSLRTAEVDKWQVNFKN